MLWLPGLKNIRWQTNLDPSIAAPSLSPGASITTGATASTKGAATQLIASTNFDVYWIVILALNYGNAGVTSRACLDIMVGAAGSEEVLVPNLLAGFCGGFSTLGAGPKHWGFPLYIPSGTRLSARACGDRTSTSMRVVVYLFGGTGVPSTQVGTKVTTYGVSALPAGTQVTPALFSMGSWTQVASSTSEQHFAFVPSMQPPEGDTSLTPIKTTYMDMGYGPVGNEGLIVGQQNYLFFVDTNETQSGPWPTMPTFQTLPAGSRLLARLGTHSSLDTIPHQEVAIHAVS